MNNILATFETQLDTKTKQQISTTYDKCNNNSEFEIMFFKNKPMNYENYLKILEYINFKNKTQNSTIEKYTTLDIIYSETSNLRYRITISSIEKINKYLSMLHKRKNHVIFSILTDISKTDPSIKLIKKERTDDNIIDIPDFDIRFRLSSEQSNISKSELEALSSLNDTKMSKIIFRFKQRTTSVLTDSNDAKLTIDLTNIKMTNNVNRLSKTNPSFELELDLSPKKSSVDKKHLQTIYTEINTLFQIIQQSNYITSKTTADHVLKKYAELTKADLSVATQLDARNPQSLEVQHIIDKLQNKYCVTDKADGDRNFLIIHDAYVFLISNNLSVRTTGINVKTNNFDGSILDGELIFVKTKNKYIFLAFDCLFNGKQDIRTTESMSERLHNVDQIIDVCFTTKAHKKYSQEDYTGDFNTKSILAYHDKNIQEYMNSLVHDIDVPDKTLLVRRKYFIHVFGGKPNEIFKYANLLWNKYIHDKTIKLPYTLDGLIFHPQEQKYISSVRESTYLEYKWKPEEKNSIDFFVTYEKNEDGKTMTLYDNSDDDGADDYIRNKHYRILNLFVGKMVDGVMQPVLFNPEQTVAKYLAYMYLSNGEVRDVNGDIIQDETVVEFYYNNNMDVPDKQRWVPLRTRFDKTEQMRHGKSFGNYITTAYSVWRSIRNPITLSDFSILADDKTYNDHFEVLQKKIDHSIILSERKENAYYQIKEKNAANMRAFHNWVKSILIYTIFNPAYHGKRQTVLDLGIGVGGDITSPTDGANSRYERVSRNKPNFPKMVFINADVRNLLTYEEQNKALGGMSQRNADLFNKYFSADAKKRTTFDCISCQFAFHYFLQTPETWKNTMENINMHLKPNGYMIITTLDGDKVIDMLKKHDGHYTLTYNTPTGENKPMFDIVKKYEEEQLQSGTGIAIDFFNSLISQEGKYITEYLVRKDFLISELKRTCNMVLEDTDTFENLYKINKPFLTDASTNEQGAKTRAFFADVAKFFDHSDEINRVSYEYTKLHRFFIFKKN